MRSAAASPATPPRGADRIVAVAVLCFAVVLAVQGLALPAGVLDSMSTDDLMRLVQVRDLLGGQRWFDLTQHRLGPAGVPMHWSRVIDAPLAGSILILSPLLGQHTAEMMTVVVWPLLLFGAALVLVAAIARQLAGNVIMVSLAAVALALLGKPPLVHFRPGAIDHHNAQTILLLALLYCALHLERSAWTAALAAFAASLSLAIGLEMLPAVGVICAVIAARLVWSGHATARNVGIFGTSLAACSLVLAAVLVPWPSLSPTVCDSFGAPVLLLTVGGGAGLIVVAAVDRLIGGRLARMLAACAAFAAVAAAFVSLYGACLASPYSQVDPLVSSLWLSQLQETVSLAKMLRVAPEETPGFYGFPAITLVLVALALRRAQPAQRFRWILSGAMLAAMFGTSLWQLRGVGGAAMLAAPLFAAAAATVLPKFATGRSLPLLALAVSPAALTILGFAARPLTDIILRPQFAVPAASTCSTPSDVEVLSRLAAGRIMAPTDLAPAILVTTNHHVFAAPYHRNNAGNRAMFDLMLAPADQAHEILRANKADYVLVCRRSPNPLVINLANDGLEAQLAAGRPPAFLEPIDLGADARVSVWRFRE